jgi:hypothetical protein
VIYNIGIPRTPYSIGRVFCDPGFKAGVAFDMETRLQVKSAYRGRQSEGFLQSAAPHIMIARSQMELAPARFCAQQFGYGFGGCFSGIIEIGIARVDYDVGIRLLDSFEHSNQLGPVRHLRVRDYRRFP